MKKILVTTDYSSNSKAGIRFALQFAYQSKCEIIFYHVFEGVEINNWNVIKSSKNKVTPEIERLNKLKKFVHDVYIGTGLPIIKYKCVIETGFDTKNLIIDYAKKNKVNFICISTRGAGVIKKLLGTTTSSLIEHSPVPILAIPKTYRIKPIQEIWYSSDLVNLKSELATVQKFTQPFKSDIHVYHYDFMVQVDEIMANLKKKTAKYTTKDVHFHFRKMQIDKTISELLQNDMAKHKPSLVVLFTKQNRSWIDRMIYRNNSAEATFDIKAPLLILKKKSN